MVRMSVPQSVDTEKIKESAAEVAAALSGVSTKAAKEAVVLAGQAKDAAVHARGWAEPRVEAFIEWLTPRAEKAWNDSVQASAPRVQLAANKVAPVVDTAHDKIVDEYLPRIVTAFNEAATRAAVASAGVEAAKGKVGKRAEKAARKAMDKAAKQAARSAETKSSGGKGLMWVLVALISAALGYVFWRRAQPQNDPWAEPWEQATGPDYDGVARDAKYKVGDAAEAVGEAAGVAVARGREASGRVTEAVDKATEAAREATRKAASRTRGSRSGSTTSADIAAEEPTPELPGEEPAAPGTDAVVDAAEETKPDQT